MSRLKWIAAIVLTTALTASANLLLNPGFESQLANWTTWGSQVAAETWAARSGSYGAAMYGWVTGGGGIYQDVAVGGVSNYTFSIYGFRDNNFPSRTVEVRLEFYDSSYTQLGSTSRVVSGSASWQLFSVSAQNPNNTAYVRPVLAYSDGGTDGGAFKWDDGSLTSANVIPEPASVSLLAIGLMALHRVWRRGRS